MTIRYHRTTQYSVLADSILSARNIFLFQAMAVTELTRSKFTYIHTYIDTGFIGIWQPEAGLNAVTVNTLRLK